MSIKFGRWSGTSDSKNEDRGVGCIKTRNCRKCDTTQAIGARQSGNEEISTEGENQRHSNSNYQGQFRHLHTLFSNFSYFTCSKFENPCTQFCKTIPKRNYHFSILMIIIPLQFRNCELYFEMLCKPFENLRLFITKRIFMRQRKVCRVISGYGSNRRGIRRSQTMGHTRGTTGHGDVVSKRPLMKQVSNINQDRPSKKLTKASLEKG